MENTKEIYKQLTDVDIDEQISKWDERGKGYYGEYKVLENILYGVKGDFKVLMNVEIPFNNKTTEMDLLLIHEIGIFIFEIKYYKGTIYGNSEDEKWTQFFRTVKNSVFLSPITQNDYHIMALKGYFPTIPIFSVIAFTNNECKLKIENNRSDVIITNISDVAYNINSKIDSKARIHPIEELDLIFNKLKEYSKVKETKEAYINDNKLSFNELTDYVVKDYIRRIEEVDIILNKKIEEAIAILIKKKKRYIKTFIIALLVLVSAVITSYFSMKAGFYIQVHDAFADRDKAIIQLNEMKQRFKEVSDYSNASIQINTDAFQVVNYSLSKDNAIKNVYHLKFSIKNNSNYILQLLENTEVVVHLKNGEVRSYPIYGARLTYNKYFQRISSGSQTSFLPLDLLDINDKITYIKLSNIELTKIENNKETPVLKNFEIELFRENN